MKVTDLQAALVDKRERLAPGPRSIADLVRALPLWQRSTYDKAKRRGTSLRHGTVLVSTLVRGEQPGDARRLRNLVGDCELCRGRSARCPGCDIAELRAPDGHGAGDRPAAPTAEPRRVHLGCVADHRRLCRRAAPLPPDPEDPE